ncbi:MAG TPA: tetratricopeptide repeat protein [Anaerolineaceae bacterium]
MTISCPKCHFDNPANMRFCGNCGAPLTPTAALPRQNSPGLPGQPVDPAYLDRFPAYNLDTSSQRRNITVMFVDLSGYTSLSQQIDNEELYNLVQNFIRLMINDVYKYGGTVDKLTGDGLMALFGVPVAHENNAERAIRAALDMNKDVNNLSQQLADRLNQKLSIHVGLHSGSVIIGGLGSESMISYTAIGDTVNLANRLSTAAEPESILVSEAVFHQTSALFNFEPVLPLALKGIEHPVVAYRVTGMNPKPGSTRGLRDLNIAMIGRETELHRLLQNIDRLVVERSGGIALVMGEAGIGKSRLVTEMKAVISQNPLTIIEGRSLTYRKSVPYWLFLELISHHAGVSVEIHENELQTVLRDHVRRIMGTGANDVLPYILHMFSPSFLDAPTRDRLLFLEPGQLRQRIFLAVRDYLFTAARNSPLVLILEDLHWADESSLDLLQFLMEATTQEPIFYVCISRSFESGKLKELVNQSTKRFDQRTTKIQLHALNTEQINLLLGSLLKIPNLPKALQEQIIQRSAGIPLYVEEILRKLIEEKIITQENGEWSLNSAVNLSSIGVPETLQDLIMGRFDQLSSEEQKILQVAAVIGQHFPLPVLMSILGNDGIQSIDQSLSSLIDRGFIIKDTGTSDLAYQFKHVLVSDTIYSTLLKRNSRELHGEVGKAIEKVYANRLESQVDLLANHYLRSNQADRGLHYAILAGQKASRGYANEQARQYYEQALALLPKTHASPEQILQVHSGLGDVLVIIGEFQAARDQYQLGLEATNSFDPHRMLLENSVLHRKIASSFERQGDFDKALSRLFTSQETLSRITNPPALEQARILNDIGWIYFRRGSLDEAESTLLQALSLIKTTSQVDIIASIYNRLGGVYFRKEDLARASEYTRQSLTIREEIGDILGAARSYNNLGLLQYAAGNWDQALISYKRNLELQNRIGDTEAIAISHRNIAELQIDMGDWQDARRNLELSLQAARKIRASFHIAVAHASLGRLLIAQAAYSQALAQLEESIRIFYETGVQENMVDVYHLKGEAYLGLGKYEQAVLWANKSIEVISSLGSRSLSRSEQHGRALRLLGKAAMAQKDWKTAHRYLVSSNAIFKVNSVRLEEARTLVEMSRLALAQEDSVTAKKHLQEAQAVFRQLGARVDLRTSQMLMMILNPNADKVV